MVAAAVAAAAAVPGAGARVTAASHGGSATASKPAQPRCAARPAAAVGDVRRAYRISNGCVFLQPRHDAGRSYERFRALVVRRKGKRYMLAFPWPALSKAVAGTCHGERQTFAVAWPLVTYSIPLCSEDGGAVPSASLGGTNRATGIFRAVTGPSGTPLRLVPVVVPPPSR